MHHFLIGPKIPFAAFMIVVLFRAGANLVFCGLPCVFLLFCALMLQQNAVFGPLDFPQNLVNTDRQTLYHLMMLRDFSMFSAEELRVMTARIEREFGRHGTKPTFSYSKPIQRVFVFFLKKRPPAEAARTATSASRFESNLLLMIRMRFFDTMLQTESSPPAKKAAMMKEVAADLKYWNSVYTDFLQALDQPVPSLMELYREYELMIAQFKAGVTPEKAVRIDQFSRLIIATSVSQSFQLW